MYLSGTPEEITGRIVRDAPNLNALEVARRCREIIAPHKAQLLEWQGAALYALAKRFNRCGAHILEIGTACGYSAAVLVHACPNASITSLNPAGEEIEIAAGHLRPYGQVTLLRLKSWDYLDIYHGPELDMVFVDGDHKRVAMDIPWFRWVRPYGLMLFHDYSPTACPPVFAAVNEFGTRLGRQPDVVIMDDQNIGIAGFYKRGKD